MKHFLALLVIGMLLLAACAAGRERKENGYAQIDQETAKQMMARDDGHVLVDVRRQDEYDAGHIPGAMLIPNESIGGERPEALPDPDQIILIYCRSGNRSKQAAQKLADMGYSHIYEFGGIITWTGDIVTAEEESAGKTAALVYSSFAGGGPEYSVEIGDEGVLACAVRYDYGGAENEDLDGAGYDVIFTLSGRRPGETALTVRWQSPISDADSGEAYYTVTVDERLNIALKKEPAMTLQIYDRTFTAALEDNETARAFAALLPMELSMTELNGNEKYHYLMSGLPAAPERVGHIEAGDIMLFGDDCVVVFYQSFDTPYSYTRIGKISNTEYLAEQLGDGGVQVYFAQGE